MVDDDKSKYSTGNESADIFFSCETFEVVNMDMDYSGPGLLFRSFTGHHIEFQTGSVNPMEHMTLQCDGKKNDRSFLLSFHKAIYFLGWCKLTCKRIKKDQSIGQSIQYTLLSAFEEKFFSDITIKSCDRFSVSFKFKCGHPRSYFCF